MRRSHLAIALIAGLALAGPPAKAATWSGSLFGTGVFEAPIAVDQAGNPTAQGALVYDYRLDGSPTWMICDQRRSPWTGYSTTAFDSPCETFRGGSTFGGPHVAPTGLGATGYLSIDWFSAMNGQSTTVDDRDIGRIYLDTDRTRLYQTLTRTLRGNLASVHEDLRAFHSLIWYNVNEPGVGMTTDFAGGTPGTNTFLGFFGYGTANSGQDEWRIATGNMTTPSMGSFSLLRCIKLSAAAVQCDTEQTVTIRTRLVSTLGGAVMIPEIDVTFSSTGVTKTYRRWAY